MNIDIERKIEIMTKALDGKLNNGSYYDGFDIDMIVESIDSMVFRKVAGGNLLYTPAPKLFVNTGLGLSMILVQLPFDSENQFGCSESSHQSFFKYRRLDDVLIKVENRLNDLYKNKFDFSIVNTSIEDDNIFSLEVKITKA